MLPLINEKINSRMAIKLEAFVNIGKINIFSLVLYGKVFIFNYV